MADPLSVASGVVGLLTAAAQVSLVLKDLISKARDAPQSCRRVRNEVEDIRNVLGQLQLYLTGGRQATSSRRALIMIDQVAATLASCVTTFDALKVFVESIQSDLSMGILDRVRWTYKSNDLEDFQTRLEAQKSSLTLMLIILTCQKQDDAEDKVDALHAKVEQIYALNVMIAQRMLAWDMSQISQLPTVTQASGDKLWSVTRRMTLGIRESPADDQFADDTPTNVAGVAPENIKRDSRGFAFEELLMNSRAYRSAAHNNSDGFSVISAAGRTATWSMLSGLSLSELSNLAILAIPVYATDLNDKEAYDFETPTTEPGINVNQVGNDLRSPGSSSSRRSLGKWWKKFAQPPAEAALPAPNQDRHIVFGAPLEQSIKYANVAISLTNESGEQFVYGYIPITVGKCGVFLKEKATNVEDIFAVTGHAARVANIQKILDTGPRYGNGLDWTGSTVHDAAGVLLRYLKSLPEPVIPYGHYDAFTAPFRNESTATDLSVGINIKVLQQRMSELPALNRQLLLYILDMLAVISSKADVNKMTAERLVASFQPSLLSKRPSEMDYDEHVCSARVAIFLVEQQDHFLIGMTMDGTTEFMSVKYEDDGSSHVTSPRTATSRTKTGQSPDVLTEPAELEA